MCYFLLKAEKAAHAFLGNSFYTLRVVRINYVFCTHEFFRGSHEHKKLSWEIHLSLIAVGFVQQPAWSVSTLLLLDLSFRVIENLEIMGKWEAKVQLLMMVCQPDIDLYCPPLVEVYK